MVLVIASLSPLVSLFVSLQVKFWLDSGTWCTCTCTGAAPFYSLCVAPQLERCIKLYLTGNAELMIHYSVTTEYEGSFNIKVGLLVHQCVFAQCIYLNLIISYE